MVGAATKATTPSVPPSPRSTFSPVVSDSPGSGPATIRNATRNPTMTTVLPMGAIGGNDEAPAGVQHRGRDRSQAVEHDLWDEEPQQEGRQSVAAAAEMRILDRGGEQVCQPRRQHHPDHRHDARALIVTTPSSSPARRSAPGWSPRRGGRRRWARAPPTARRRRATRTGCSTRCSSPGTRCPGRSFPALPR